MGVGGVWGWGEGVSLEVWRRRYRPRAMSPAPRDSACALCWRVPHTFCLFFFACWVALPAFLLNFFPTVLRHRSSLLRTLPPITHPPRIPHSPAPVPPCCLPPLSPSFPRCTHRATCSGGGGRPSSVPSWTHAWPHGAVTSTAGAGGKGRRAAGSVLAPSPPHFVACSFSTSFLPGRPPIDGSAPGAAATALGGRAGGVGGICLGGGDGADARGAPPHTPPPTRHPPRLGADRRGCRTVGGGRLRVRQRRWPSGRRSGGVGASVALPSVGPAAVPGEPTSWDIRCLRLPSPTGWQSVQAARRGGHLWTKHNAGGRRRGLPPPHFTGTHPPLSARCGARGAGGSTLRVPPLPPYHPLPFRSCGPPASPFPFSVWQEGK